MISAPINRAISTIGTGFSKRIFYFKVKVTELIIFLLLLSCFSALIFCAKKRMIALVKNEKTEMKKAQKETAINNR
jgi:hypothetical protein